MKNSIRWKNILVSLVYGLGAFYVVNQTGLLDRLSGRTVQAAVAVDKLKEPGAQIIDVRERAEVNLGMLQGAVWIPLSGVRSGDAETERKLGRLDKAKPVYVYCRSGARAGQFVGTLKERGYTAFNVGGFSELTSVGLPSMVPTL